MVTANSWKNQFGVALKKGQDGLDDAIGLYLWARDHLKELHKVDPEYTQDETANEIARVWNVSIDTYCRTAMRLGGGSDPKSVASGREIIRRFSPFETFRAEAKLGLDQMKKLVDKLPSMAGPKDLHSAVDELREELDSLAVENVQRNRLNRIDYKKEAEKWRKRANELETKCRLLQRELNWFKSKVEIKSRSSE